MARKKTIRRRIQRNMENTKTLNEGKIRKLQIKEARTQKDAK